MRYDQMTIHLNLATEQHKNYVLVELKEYVGYTSYFIQNDLATK